MRPATPADTARQAAKPASPKKPASPEKSVSPETSASTEKPARTEKAEQTRATIAAAAQELFLERGFEKTTMRAVAQRAGVSLGNAYYYFASKEHLVQAFYDQIQQEHQAELAPTLATLDTFADRYRAALLSWLDVAAKYHGFADKFFKAAAEPSSPLSPFSSESSPARAASIELMARVLDGSNLKVPAALRAELPELLWLAQMGMVLFWVYDTSEGQKRTRLLVTTIVPVLDRLLRLTRLPVVRGVVDDLVTALGQIRAI